ncbi:hypothetical protein AB0E72_17770, partial [Streptomyces filamentosus]
MGFRGRRRGVPGTASALLLALLAAGCEGAPQALRASKGMVLDPADHDTWSAGSFFTNPILAN